LWGSDAGVAEVGMVMEIKRNIFEEKRECIHKIEHELREMGKGGLNLSIIDHWQEVTNDDDFNEP